MSSRLIQTALIAVVFSQLLMQRCLAQSAPADTTKKFQTELDRLEKFLAVEEQRREKVGDENNSRVDRRSLADVKVYAKAVEWILRHKEFYKPDYVKQTQKVLDTGWKRAQELPENKAGWRYQTGTTIRGYVSAVDQSVQPYALTLPQDFDAKANKRWPLHVKLHGRADQMNEVNFISRYDGKAAPKDQTWIQLDVYGRGSNAYRWAGETDVFEAMEDVRRRFRIDDRRITLWGFSMGGAGAWALGLHHPGRWSSVGAGAGFVDFYGYQNRTEKLPPWQHKTLNIYDAVPYAMNAYNVPFITYGGELDKQLLASKTGVAAARKVDVDIKMLVGPKMGHKFDPDSFREFMAFHAEAAKKGRPTFPGLQKIRFTTWTTKYNRCDWLEVAEMIFQYQPAVVEGEIKDGVLKLTTKNVAALKISRDAATDIEIDGDYYPLSFAAQGLLPDVYFVLGRNKWEQMGYDESRGYEESTELIKRHNLQGPIDDAFMQPFVVVVGTGTAWNQQHQAWSDWTRKRMVQEFDKWLRGKVRVVKDTDVTEELMQNNHVILFGDPGSNSLLAKVAKDLPLRWEQDTLHIHGQQYPLDEHGLSMIYPNPLSPRKYLVINSGHTFHAKDFRSSNAWLFPRLGDVAVQKFSAKANGAGFDEETVWAEIFNSGWRLPAAK